MRVVWRGVGRAARQQQFGRRGWSGSAWAAGRALLERERAEEAHALLREAAQRQLGGGAASSGAPQLPLVLLELAKALLRLAEPHDALAVLAHAVALFERCFDAADKNPALLQQQQQQQEEEEVDPQLCHARYVEALLHLAKLQFVSAQGAPEHLWKKAISHAMKHEGRESYHVLVATLGLAEYHLERLQLAEADRYTAAAAELARALPASRATRERLVEAVAMQGLGRAQRQDVDAALRFYLQGLKTVEDMEAEAGGLDPWTRSALHNLYRNIEHAYKGMDGGEEKAKEWKEKRDAKLGRFEEVVLTEKPEEDKNKNIFS
jgi:tetratricopeptide (TPR) repeat protein